MKNTWYLKNGLIIDPLTERQENCDLFIENGIIKELPSEIPGNVEQIDVQGFVLTPGLVDLHVHFREPGNEQAETIESGSKAAAKGGFTTVVAMPNTCPPVDTPERLAFTLEQAEKSNLLSYLPASCITAGRNGKELVDQKAMADAGAAAFTDDGDTVENEVIMQKAMRTAEKLELTVMDHSLDPAIAQNGVMHEGSVSSKLNLPGIPSSAETRIIERNIKLSKLTGCPIHIQHVSTKESVDIIRNAQNREIRISGEATPHHLFFTDADIESSDSTNFKINPPIREEKDRQALLNAVADNTLQALATDHAPHLSELKAKGFIDAPFGATGLETAIGATYSALVRTGLMNLMDWVRRWTTGPSKILGIEPPSLSPGSPANIAVLDLKSEWTVDLKTFLSKSLNSPFKNKILSGRSVLTFYKGRITWDGRNNEKNVC
jgi:dihydroorotase